MATTNVYILFPERVETVLETVESQERFRSFTERTVRLFKTIQKCGVKLYYDSLNVKSYFDICSEWLNVHEIENGRHAIRLFLSRTSVDINTKPLKEGQCRYILWNYDKSPTVEDNPHRLLVEMTERKYRYEEEESVLVDVCESLDACRSVLLTFKDAKHIESYPKEFVRIPFVLSQEELELWIDTHSIKGFTLFDKNRFQRTGRVYDGKPIFREISTQQLWYLDNLHKDEYEVFDSKGKHLGTAALSGVMNSNSSVIGRFIEV